MRLCECTRGPRIGKDRGCADCEHKNQQWQRSDWATTKAAAVMRFDDWLSSFEIRDRAGFPPDDSSVSKALEYMVERGEVERRVVPRMGMEYRLKQRRAA